MKGQILTLIEIVRFVVDENKVHKASRVPAVFSLRSQTFAFMADCGATYPMLAERDLEDLGIDQHTYAASTWGDIETTNGRIKAKIFELRVGIGSSVEEEAEGRSPARGAPGWPYERGIMGGLCPVGLIPNRARRVAYTDRLSGMLPFVACYTSSVPTAGRMWLGENRQEVLGANSDGGAPRVPHL